MRVRWLAVSATAAMAVAAFVAVPSVGAAPSLPPAISPAADQSTSGDYASDVLGNPWDFDDGEDVPPISGVGCVGNTPTNCSISVAGGTVTWSGRSGAVLRLVRNWGNALAWGSDGPANPVDAGRYSILTLSNCSPSSMAVTFRNDAGEDGTLIFEQGDCLRSTSIDLRQSPAWRGRIIELNLHTSPGVTTTLDWARLHRPDAPAAPPAGVPVAKVLSPNADGGADYASSYGNPWDMTDPGDVAGMQGMQAGTGPGGLGGTTSGGDAGVAFPLPVDFQTDRFHRFSADVCFAGGFGLGNIPGEGMNARIIYSSDLQRFTETQDIVVYPGCQHIAIDLAAEPPAEINDESSVYRLGWRGQKLAYLRFDPDEDPGVRGFSVSNVRFADDAAFSSSYGIQVQDASGNGGTAEVYATTNRGAFDGTLLGRVGVNGGSVATFDWNGTDASGRQLPNATYWVYTVIRNGAGVATGYSSGPVRLEVPQPPTPSDFVPLSPARVFDTRDGTGGNVVALTGGVTTRLQLAGRGGVPAAGATAVVLNVTVDRPSAPGFLTLWPSGEARPTVSSLNFDPGDLITNMVTVKVGANGMVDLFNLQGAVPVVIDVVGYYTAASTGSGRFTALSPGRVLETGFDHKIGPGGTVDVQVTGTRGVPASGVSAVAVNITVDDPSAAGYLTVYPTGEGRPYASTVNFVAGRTIANLTLAKVGAGGKVSIFNFDGAVRVVADVVGYFSASGGQFVPVTPTRIVDSRSGAAMGGPIGPGQVVTLPMGGVDPVPGNASGAVVNVTATASSAASFLTVYPTGTPRPEDSSNVNPRVGATAVPNQDYVKLGAGGQVDLFNLAGSTQVIVDVFGYITP
ncbi:MAG: hypothetical protein QM733_14490 [Ilumatobacteraceae bacterium]